MKVSIDTLMEEIERADMEYREFEYRGDSILKTHFESLTFSRFQCNEQN